MIWSLEWRLIVSHASNTMGLVPTAVTAPEMIRLGNEKTATGPVGVISIRVRRVAPGEPTEGGAVRVLVLKTPPSIT